MSLWRHLTHGLRSVFHQPAVDREIDEEVQHFLDEAIAERVAQGVPLAEAERAVRLQYGSGLAARQEVRSFGWEHVTLDLLADLRFGARLLRRGPGFTTIAVLVLGLGIGSATAIFSAVRPVLFEALPYPHGERIVSITDRSADGVPVAVTFGTFRELLARSRTLDALAAFRPWRPTVTGRGEPERLEGQRVTAGYFQLLGVEPALGAGFEPADDRPRGRAVVMLSDGIWRRRFGADRSIVGRPVTLDGEPFTVAGIMPRGFENVPPHPAEVWSLLQYDAALPTLEGREWGHHLTMIGRLGPGVQAYAARDELHRIAATPLPEQARPVWASLDQGLILLPLKDAATAGVRPALLALLGAALLVLAIACVNVTNLLLARGSRRRGELTMRTVLGAGRGRLVRQLVTEGLILSLLGGALGVLIARMQIGALVAVMPSDLPRAHAISMNGSAFVFALIVSTAIGLAFGLVPAIGATRPSLRSGMAEASRRFAIGHASARKVLVVAQVGVAVVLLVGAGLLLRSMQRLLSVPPGFDATRTVAMQVQTSGQRFNDSDAVHRFYAQALDAVSQLSGVTSAALTSQLPLSGDLDVYGVNLDDDPRSDRGSEAFRYTVSPGYLETMGIPLIRGRGLATGDVEGAPQAVVISDALARSAFPGTDPIGQRVHVGRTDLPMYTIVGVAGDVKQASLEIGPAPAAYITADQWYFADPARWFVVRTDGPAATLVPSIKRAIWSVDSDQPIVRTATMSELLRRSEAQRAFVLIVLEAFGIVALVLAALGLYGVVSGNVSERLHDIGIRSALGASRERILAMVLRQGMALTAVGMVIGMAGAAAASEAVSTLLFGISRLDPVTYGTVIAALTGASLLACWIPAARAARVDPAQTLRVD